MNWLVLIVPILQKLSESSREGIISQFILWATITLVLNFEKNLRRK